MVATALVGTGKRLTLTMAMKDFFFRNNIDQISVFMGELKKLTSNDKVEFREGLIQNGYEIIDNPAVAAVH